MNPSQRFNLVSQGDPTLLQSRILFDVSEVPVLTSSLNGWAFESGGFFSGLNMKLDISVLLGQRTRTIPAHNSLEAPHRTRITFAIATVLSLALTPLTAQDQVSAFLLQRGNAALEAGDYGTALIEFSVYADQGDSTAQVYLGHMYQMGLGTLQDYAEAVKFFRLSADQGNSIGQSRLGLMYEEGLGVPSSNKEAVRYYELAAKQGNATAQANLGYMYEHNKGVLRNKIMAHMWYNLSAANGQQVGVNRRDAIARDLYQLDIAKAQQMARECFSSDYQNCGF